MDLKSKRIFEISQIVISLAMLLLYTRIGSIGMVYVAMAFEIVFGLVLLFLSSASTNKTYCLISAILIEGLLAFIYYFVIIPSEIMFVGTFLKFSMILIPLYVALQYGKGILQAVLEPQISALTDLIFCISTVIGSVLFYFVLGNYGVKVADLMQSVKLEYFYVILSLLPGFVLGFVCAFLFLFYIGHMHKKEVLACMREVSLHKQGILKTFKEQFLNNFVLIVQRIPIILLLLLSVKEIKAENYLFGHLYGAVLPLFMFVWNFFSLTLITYRKRLFIFFRKRMDEQYYYEIKTVLSYVLIYSVFFLILTLSLHKAYLAIWSQQTSSSFVGLMKASCIIAFLGFPYKILIDILMERNRKSECYLSVLLGVILSAIVAAICHKFLGAGNALYILCIAIGMFISVLMLCWFIWGELGINYISILQKAYKAIVLNVFICLMLIIIESLIFTAFGGLGTLVICLLFGYLCLRIGILCLRIFSKEERELLSFKTNIKVILGISRKSA